MLVANVITVLCLCAGVVLAIPPPSWDSLPKETQDQFTLGGRVELKHFFVDDTDQGNKTHYVFPAQAMSQYMDSTTKALPRLLNDKNSIASVLRDALALSKTPTPRVVLFGSQEPFHECMALALGAAHVTVVEYNKLTYDHPQIVTVTVEEVLSAGESSPLLHSFDVALSLSSFDHDGLGRYGDPIDPNGDLKAMRWVRSFLRKPTTTQNNQKDGGVMVLTIPIGEDIVVWNLMRVYGPVRLPKLLEGWEVVRRYGWDESRFGVPSSNYRRTFEPPFLLRVQGVESTSAKDEL